MTPSRATPSVLLARLTQDELPVLRNLLELYVHDFSEHVAVDIKPSGRFEFPLSDVWWTRDDHFPYLVRSGDRLCGFALVRKGSRFNEAPGVMDIAEFFILRGVRRKKIGMSVAHALFAAFPGTDWHIRVRGTNAPAKTFWGRAVESWMGHPVRSEAFVANGIAWDVFRMEGPRDP